MTQNLLFALMLSTCGCAAERPATQPEAFHPRYAIYTERSQTDPAALTADEAKAILVAHAACVDLAGGGNGALGIRPWIYEVFTVPDGWYVCFHFGEIAGEKTAHVNRDWKVNQIIYGNPPPTVIAGTQPSSKPE